ncbi:MAG: acyl-CoA thioesterase [Verrucomicrobiales bacterium]|jgi:acyl-CoA thioester hydrolase|nr:acyl-CoA thioesterase [Verrucomicrobiales bacterium]
MKHHAYFKTAAETPPPLTLSITRAVRFDELDPLSIVWHGRYASWFEEARMALGDHYGFGYLDFFNHGVTIPLKKFHADFNRPLTLGLPYRVTARLCWNEAARLDYEFAIHNADGELMSTGYSVHLMIDRAQGVLVAKPPFFEDFCRRWRRGEVG